VIEAKCPKCGKLYFGWSLLNPRNQNCTNCGSGLLFLEDGKMTVQGYSPFPAGEYKPKLPYQTDPEKEK
jgi:DNA-directed RNA polymerase subunit RPC12/RpoP